MANERKVLGYLPNDQPEIGPLIGLAFQHVLTMFPATVLSAILMGFDVGVTLFAAGVGTIAALLISSRVGGTYIPLFYGGSFSYIAPVMALVAKNAAGDDITLGLRMAQGGIVFTAILNIIVGLLIQYIGKENLDRILPSEVTGSVAIVIGVALAGAAIDMAAANWGVALITLVTTILFSVYLRGKGVLGLFPILLGAAVGYVVSIPLGLVEFQKVMEAAWIQMPNFQFPVFSLSAIAAIAPIAIATIPESTAHLYQISLYVDQLADELGKERPRLSRLIGLNLVCDGVADGICGLLGAGASTNYGENNSLMAITRNYSGPVIMGAGVIAILLGFVGKLSALVNTLPTAVTGGLSIFLFGVIAAQGIALQIAEKTNLFDPRKLAIVAIILIFGIGGSFMEGSMIRVFGLELPAIATSAVVGILINLIFMFVPATHIDEEFEKLDIDSLKV